MRGPRSTYRQVPVKLCGVGSRPRCRPRGRLSHPRSCCSGRGASPMHTHSAGSVTLSSPGHCPLVDPDLWIEKSCCFCFSECAFRTGPLLTKQNRRQNTPGLGRGRAVALGFWVKSWPTGQSLKDFQSQRPGVVIQPSSVEGYIKVILRS